MRVAGQSLEPARMDGVSSPIAFAGRLPPSVALCLRLLVEDLSYFAAKMVGGERLLNQLDARIEPALVNNGIA
jgi:hypothetical protein